jgi:hypothetical protein
MPQFLKDCPVGQYDFHLATRLIFYRSFEKNIPPKTGSLGGDEFSLYFFTKNYQ